MNSILHLALMKPPQISIGVLWFLSDKLMDEPFKVYQATPEEKE